MTNPGDAPGVHIIDPLAAIAGDNVSMTISHDSWQRVVLLPPCHQNRAGIASWVGMDPTIKIYGRQIGDEFICQIALKGVLTAFEVAFRPEGHTS